MGKNILSILKVLIVAYVITGLLLLLSAFLMFKFNLGEGQVRIFVMTVYGIATIVAGIIYGKIKGSKRLLNGACIGLIYFLMLMLVSLVINKGLEDEIHKIIISMIICIAGGSIGGIISWPENKKNIYL